MTDDSLHARLVAAHRSFVGEVRVMPDGYGSFVHFGPEEMADRIVAVVADWLTTKGGELAEERLAGDWHQNQCGCDAGVAGCQHQRNVPATWSVQGVAEAQVTQFFPPDSWWATHDLYATAKEVADQISEELGAWTLGQVGSQGLWDAIWDTWEPFQTLTEADQARMFAAVEHEVYG